MLLVNIHDAKTNLSKYLARLEQEEKIVICKHNKPVAELLPIKQETQSTKRPIGLAEGEFSIPSEFFDPLPEDILKHFNGE